MDRDVRAPTPGTETHRVSRRLQGRSRAGRPTSPSVQAGILPHGFRTSAGPAPDKRRNRLSGDVSTTQHQENTMLYYAIVFLIIALVAGFFGFFGIAGLAASIAKILFVIFIILFIVSLVFGRRRRL